MTDRTRTHIGKLDGLRGLAAGTVLVSHISNEFDLFDRLLGGGAGSIGVALFFVLSGYLMGHLYADTKLNLRSCYIYSVKRFARVYPLFFIVVGVAALAFSFRDPSPAGLWPIDFALWLRHVFLVSGISVFWTIPVECHFYAVFVLVWGYFRLNLNVNWLNTGLGLFIVLYIGFVVSSDSIFLQRADVLTGYLFFMGVFVSRISGYLSTLQKFGDTIFALAVGAYLLSFPNIYQMVFSNEQLIFRSYETGVAVSLLLISAFIPSRVSSLVLENAFARWCGQISYSMYLIHLPIVLGVSHLWNEVVGPQYIAGAVIVIFLLVFGCSWASNILLERPLQRLALKTFLPKAG